MQHQPGFLARGTRAGYLAYQVSQDIQDERKDEDTCLGMPPNAVTLDDAETPYPQVYALHHSQPLYFCKL